MRIQNEPHERGEFDRCNERSSGARSARDDARRWAEEDDRRQDAARVRSALVAELRELGYEVNVQGDWSEGERITAARPNEPN